MLVNPAPEELRERLEQFVRYRREHLRGDEKGEAQVFLDRLFRGFGHEGIYEAGATLEMRVARRSRGNTAFADLVWKPRVLIEMKKSGEDLSRHYRQAFEYWFDLVPDRPRFVILCNFDELWVYDLNHQVEEPVDVVQLDQLPRRWEALTFLLPREETPTFANDLIAVTRETAATVSGVFNLLIGRGIPRPQAQRFVLQAVMAMFSEDIGLLPRHSFTRAVRDSLEGESAYDLLFGLFEQMNRPGVTLGGRYEGTPYFNGGLFREVEPFELAREELDGLEHATHEDWSAVRPAIFGTLFEQSLEAGERHAYGAHFTSEADIQKVVLPTIVRPWRQRIAAASSREELGRIEDDLLAYRVLDPACGCGNFLYVAYRELRRVERELAERTREIRRGAEPELRLSFVSTTQMFGLDINAFAVEVAKVTLMLARKLAADELGDERTVLPLDDLDTNVVAGDALRRPWPAVEAIIGNPPYLGRRRIVEERGAGYSSWLAERFPDVRGVSDYVVYWFRLAHDRLPDRGRAGLVGTNSIRSTSSRAASLDYIADHGGVIYDAVASQPWSGDAAVHVSIVNWVKGENPTPKTLWLSNGTVRMELDHIAGSLSPDLDLTEAKHLPVNVRPKRFFQGQTPGHTQGFVLTAEQAQRLLDRDPMSAEVIHPFLTGDELNSTGQPGRFIIDIPADDAVSAGRWPGALDHVRTHVLPTRENRATREAERNAKALQENSKARVNWHHAGFRDRWWRLAWRRGDMVAAIQRLPRYIALSIVAVEARPSIYAFVSPDIRPAAALQVFAFADDYAFGILNSSLHRAWFLGRCSDLGVSPRYTSSTVFDTFPWPQALTPEAVEGVVSAVVRLLDFRDDRLAEGISLVAQYDSLREVGRNPLRVLHDELDRAVSVAYGLTPNDEPMAQLLALNESIADEAARGQTQPRAPGGGEMSGISLSQSRIEPAMRLTTRSG